MRKLLVLIAIPILLMSCSIFTEDEFGNVIGAWEHPPLPGYSYKKMPPDIPKTNWEISVNFNKNLTGSFDKTSNQNDYETDSFTYNVKRDTLTIEFDRESANNWYVISGVNTYKISNNKLILKAEEGTILELNRK